MKNIFTTVLFSFVALALFGQQEPQTTQFMQYKLGYNPAFAGSQEAAAITAIYRNQWLGLDGAPETQILSFNMPLLNQRVGVGANLVRSTIGITTTYDLDAVYAYRFRVGPGMLGLGIQGSVRSLQNEFQRTRASQPIASDPSIPANQENKFLFNFGAGVYYNTENFYIGVSIPRLIQNNINFNEGVGDVVISREVQHVYLMGGLILNLNERIKLQPQALVKYVNNAPFDLDGNLSVIFDDKFIFGVTYRLGGNKNSGVGESIDVLASAQVSKNILFGVSYDITLSELNNYSHGSIELGLHYFFGKSEGDEYVNPRFF